MDMAVEQKDYSPELLQFSRMQWEKNIQNQVTWMYHGTSILFLPYIQRYGLDTSKLPPGIKKGIESLSKILQQHEYKPSYAPLDIAVNMDAKRLSFTFWKDNVVRAASTTQLPAFIYELFNEDYLRANPDVDKIIRVLNPEEQKLFAIIMRFGRILRQRNKMVIIQVRIDSAFLRYLGLPDFISSYDTFFLEYLQKQLGSSDISIFTPELRNKIIYSSKDIVGPFLELYTELARAHGEKFIVGTMETTFMRSIPPPFIYIEVQNNGTLSLVNIAKWNETMNPTLVSI
ncbi:MAG: hypothetical protein Q8R18_04235 [bacterium]|nr:hypothetical protein [bacterium]